MEELVKEYVKEDDYRRKNTIRKRFLEGFEAVIIAKMQRKTTKKIL